VTLTTSASCAEAAKEVNARIAGQYEDWYDPHNNGTYSLLSDDTGSGGLLQLERVTGNKKYTDKINFSFSDSGGGCSIDACSQSQVTSIADYSTNYCNSRVLYCGAADGCKGSPGSSDLGAVETKVSPSLGASADPSACLVV
jgi:hypothetical protein